MSTAYPGNIIPTHPSATSIYDGHYVVTHLLESLDHINTTGQTIRIYFDSSTFTEQVGNGQVVEHYTGIDNHFQSIVRHRSGEYLIMSGGDKRGQLAHLIVIKIESYRLSNRLSKTHVMGSNLVRPHIWKLDEIKRLFIIEQGAYWHAGGISLLGDILVVPLESNNSSRIVFIDASNPIELKRLPNFINRSNEKSGCVSMLKLSTNQYLCAVWTDSDNKQDRFDFYLSKSSDIQSMYDLVASVSADQIKHKGHLKPRLQSIQFIVDQHDDIFITGMDNSSRLNWGTNRIFLFKVDIHILSNKPNSSYINSLDITIDMLRCKSMQNGGRYYNFGSAPGAYADAAGRLRFYCGYTWKNQNHLHLAEFSISLASFTQSIQSTSHAQLELFTDTDYQDRQLIVYGHRHDQIPDLKDTLIANNGHIGDKISSIRYILPENTKYVLYEDDTYNHDWLNKNELTLLGTGRVEQIPDLSDHQFVNHTSFASLKYNKSFGDKISSLRLITF